jgi:hypothetical protein
MFGKQVVKQRTVANVTLHKHGRSPRQLRHSLKGLDRAIAQIVHYHQVVPDMQQWQRGVGPNVSCATSYEKFYFFEHLLTYCRSAQAEIVLFID